MAPKRPKKKSANRSVGKAIEPAVDDLNIPETALDESALGARTLRTVTDYISGRTVRASAEELDAVQVFSRRLVEELGYACVS
jgi:hypothetical protein